MAKLNAKYELMAVYSLAKGEEVAKELVEKRFQSKIEAAATLDEVNEWGKRSSHTRSTMNRTAITHCIASQQHRIFRLNWNVS